MKRVLVYSPLRLIGEGLVSLLSGGGGVEVVGFETDWERTMQRACDIRPDVIVLSSDSPTDVPSPLVLRLWRGGCRAKIIELDLKGRSLAAYQADQAVVKDPIDLFRAIEEPLGTLGSIGTIRQS